jgi:predicted oxidoreductase
MDATNLRSTIEIYNRNCALGNDPEFKRAPETLLLLQRAPYYAVPLYPGLVSTCGGPVRSGNAEVLDIDRKPIPRLYSAGSCGSVYGRTYSVTGGNLGELCAFGRIAGRNVAVLPPWA